MTVDALSDERTPVPAPRRGPEDDTVQVDPALLNRTRREAGATYAALAEAGDVSKSMISHLCRGRTVTCRRALGEAIEDALGVSRGYLFKDPDYETLRTRRGARTLNPLPLERTIEKK